MAHKIHLQFLMQQLKNKNGLCLYFKKQPSCIILSPRILFEYPVNAESYSSAFTIPSLMKS